jgi:hypothetical protein
MTMRIKHPLVVRQKQFNGVFVRFSTRGVQKRHQKLREAQKRVSQW